MFLGRSRNWKSNAILSKYTTDRRWTRGTSDRRIDRRTDRTADRQIDRTVDRRTDRTVDRRLDITSDKRIDRRMDRQIDRRMKPDSTTRSVSPAEIRRGK